MSGLRGPDIDPEEDIEAALNAYFNGESYGINYLTNTNNLKNLSLIKRYYTVFLNIVKELRDILDAPIDVDNDDEYNEEVNKRMSLLSERITPYINSVLGTPINNLNLYAKNKIDLKQTYNRVDNYKKVIVPNFLMAMNYFDYYWWEEYFGISFYEYFYPQCETIIKSNLEASNEHGRLNNSVNYYSIFKQNNPRNRGGKKNQTINDSTFIKAIKTITNWEDVDFKNNGINENEDTIKDNFVIVVYDGMKVDYSDSNYYICYYDTRHVSYPDKETGVPTFLTNFYHDSAQYNISKFQAVLYPDFVFQYMIFKKHFRNEEKFSNFFDKISFYAIQWPEALTETTVNDIESHNTYNLNTGNYIYFNDTRDNLNGKDISLKTTGTDIIRLFENDVLLKPLFVIYKSTSYTETEIENTFLERGNLDLDYEPLVENGDDFLFNYDQYIKIQVNPGVIILSLSDNVKINFEIDNTS